MTDETKIKMMEALAKSGMSVGQFVMENTGTITYNDNRGAEKQEKKDSGSQSGSKEAIMEYGAGNISYYESQGAYTYTCTNCYINNIF